MWLMEKCLKRFSKQFKDHSNSGNDGYLFYRRISTDNNGRSILMKENQQNIGVDVENRWVVVFLSLLLKNQKHFFPGTK